MQIQEISNKSYLDNAINNAKIYYDYGVGQIDLDKLMPLNPYEANEKPVDELQQKIRQQGAQLAKNHYDIAIDLMHKLKFNTAYQSLQEALILDPNNSKYQNVMLGLCCKVEQG